mgnify:CR=1 FL=1
MPELRQLGRGGLPGDDLEQRLRTARIAQRPYHEPGRHVGPHEGTIVVGAFGEAIGGHVQKHSALTAPPRKDFRPGKTRPGQRQQAVGRNGPDFVARLMDDPTDLKTRAHVSFYIGASANPATPATAIAAPTRHRRDGLSFSITHASGITTMGVAATMASTTPLGVVASAHW